MNILFVSLGCDKNLSDTEMMLGMLQKSGYTFTDDETLADIVVVNTCCFIGDAKEESINTLLEYAEMRKSGQLKVLIAAGCLAQRYREEIQEEIPEVDAIVGTLAIDNIVEAVNGALAGDAQNFYRDINAAPSECMERVLTTGGHFAYLKIAEGCNKRCTYCVIPKVRGNFRSVPMEVLEAQARKLAEGGVRELILVAQETTLYGMDLYGKKALPELLRRLAAISDIYWIRVLYCYPEEITDELIEVIAAEPKVCHYLDIPIQHCNDKVLKLMNRRDTKASLVELFDKLRERIPGLVLRTSLIAGLPGEGKEEFEELCEFLRDVEIERAGVFPYSPEEGTKAAKMERVDTEEAKRRAELAVDVQSDIIDAYNESVLGEEREVLCEGFDSQAQMFFGRSYAESPDIDGRVYFTADEEVAPGTFVMVRFTDTMDGELTGEMV